MEKLTNTIAQFILIFLVFNVNFAVVEYMQKLSYLFQSQAHSVTTESINDCQMYRK